MGDGLINSARTNWLLSALVIWLLVAFGLYLIKFTGGLSDRTEDWSYFGSYIGGVVTLPITVATLFVVYRTYKVQQQNLVQTMIFNRETTLLAAVNKSIEDLDNGLNSIYANLTKHGLVTYADVFCSPELFKAFVKTIRRDDHALTKAKILIGKKLLGLYDLLGAYESNVGTNEVIRSIKIRYQYYYSLINENAELLVQNSYVTSEKMETFFYQLDERDMSSENTSIS